MWNTIASSKLSQCAQFKKSYQVHKSKLQLMKPIIKIKQPYQPQFIYTKPKLQMSRKDRLMEIDKQNCILLNKLDHIYDNNNYQAKQHRSYTINHNFNSIIQQRIDVQNKRICRKLLKTNSHYQTNQIIHHSHHLQKISLNLSQNARRTKSVSRLSSARPSSSMTSASSKFVRTGNQCQKENKYESLGCERKVWNRPGSAPSVRVVKSRQQKEEVLEKIDTNIKEQEQEQQIV